MSSSLNEGAWIEFRDDEDNRRPARLSYISPLKGTYLFVNRQGKKVGEYSLYQLAREFRTGRAVHRRCGAAVRPRDDQPGRRAEEQRAEGLTSSP